jgi:hypothetical protein
MHSFMGISYRLILCYFIGCAYEEITYLSSYASFMVFKTYETMYTQFHLNKTSSLSLFVTFLPCHQNCLYDTKFNKNETPLKIA